jgi:hypothetical protein
MFRDITSRLAESCLVQIMHTDDPTWRLDKDSIATFKTSEDHVVLDLPGLRIAIPWEDLEEILESLELERGRLRLESHTWQRGPA